ncbi:hypothetical protein [Pseudomonas quasicaspiana]|uniref:hypothetical protein n=1 Tax=Pseudomonas quasicaspiana TaxID=2829821 RepID=UPI001E3F9263|nr:hypothetical protein [Pseudomonas quasicaspiana]MCD5972560.1 hypothetical protein [Pseudomonas quasicaspiana]
MSHRSYNFGVFLGTAVREIIRATRPAPKAFAQTSPALVALPKPVLTDAQVAEYSQTSAIARKGVDLDMWFKANTKESPLPSRKPRKRKAKPAVAAQKSADGMRFGPLNELIA